MGCERGVAQGMLENVIVGSPLTEAPGLCDFLGAVGVGHATGEPIEGGRRQAGGKWCPGTVSKDMVGPGGWYTKNPPACHWEALPQRKQFQSFV